MEQTKFFIKVTIIFVALVAIISCGVKGVPQPPNDPPPLGNGKPRYYEQKKTIKNKYKNKDDEEADSDSVGGTSE